VPPLAKPASPRQLAEEKQSAFLVHVASLLRDVTEELANVDRQLAPLKDRRKLLASERDRLRKLMYDTPTFEKRNGTAQGLYVHTRYFLPYIKEWIDDYNAIHGKGGQAMLARKASVSSKNIRSYVGGQIGYAGIVTVDRILTAMDRQDLMHNLPFVTVAQIGMGGNTRVPHPPPTQYYED
jgi:hypothetical protein